MRKMSIRFKLLTSITLCTLALGAGVYCYLMQANTEQASAEGASECRRLVAQMAEVRGYYTEHVAALCRSQGMAVTPDYAGKANAVPAPTTMVREISDLLSRNENGYSVRLYTRYPFIHRKDDGGRETVSRKSRFAIWKPTPRASSGAART
jgi:methyl-accepting chemotaxis protein